jgi:hypothetical protein
MTLWSAAGGDPAAAMKEGPLPSQRGRGGMWVRALLKKLPDSRVYVVVQCALKRFFPRTLQKF